MEQTKRPSYTYVQDPGHGWIGVPVEELHLLGIADKITDFSYYALGVAWLEEDCDASLWFNAFKKHHGIAPTLVSHHVNSTGIRNMPRYNNLLHLN